MVSIEILYFDYTVFTAFIHVFLWYGIRNVCLLTRVRQTLNRYELCKYCNYECTFYVDRTTSSINCCFIIQISLDYIVLLLWLSGTLWLVLSWDILFICSKWLTIRWTTRYYEERCCCVIHQTLSAACHRHWLAKLVSASGISTCICWKHFLWWPLNLLSSLF